MVDGGSNMEAWTRSSLIKEVPSSLLGVEEVPFDVELVLDAGCVSLEGASIPISIIGLHYDGGW